MLPPPLLDDGELDLSHNRLNGTLPASIADLAELQTLDFGYNAMSGYLPDLPASLDDVSGGAVANFYGPNQTFWCPFPADSAAHAVWTTVDCTCMGGSRCPMPFDAAAYFAEPVGACEDVCERNCSLCGVGR